jgi:hypothetical protein
MSSLAPDAVTGDDGAFLLQSKRPGKRCRLRLRRQASMASRSKSPSRFVGLWKALQRFAERISGESEHCTDQAPGRRMRRVSAASGCLPRPYLGMAGAGDVGAGDVGLGAAPVVPDGEMISATRWSFGSINKTVLLSSLMYSRFLAAGT